MSTHRVTAKAAATAALLLVGGLALAPDAGAWPGEDRPPPNGLNGISLNGVDLNGLTRNGQWTQGSQLNGRELNGSHAQGHPTGDDTAELGAVQIRSIRLPDGRTLLVR
jgi:hypothetical protein